MIDERSMARLAENGWLKAGARLLMPVLLAVVGAFGTYVLNTVKNDIAGVAQSVTRLETAEQGHDAAIWKKASDLGGVLNTVATSVAQISERVASNRERADDHEKQLADQLGQVSKQLNEMDRRRQ